MTDGDLVANVNPCTQRRVEPAVPLLALHSTQLRLTLTLERTLTDTFTDVA